MATTLVRSIQPEPTMHSGRYSRLAWRLLTVVYGQACRLPKLGRRN